VTKHSRIQLLLATALAFLVHGCTPHLPAPTKHTVPALVKIKIEDQMLQDLAQATERVSISASGEFTPGNYVIKDTTVKIQPGTLFTLQLSVPIDNPSFISTENATGKLSTTKPLIIKGLPAPQSIELKDGKATGDVDILKTVGVFFLNVLQDQFSSETEASDVHNMVANMHVEHAVLSMRPGAYYKVRGKKLHCGTDSTVELNDIAIDSGFNLDGTCVFHLKFLEGSQWVGQRTDCLFNGGKADVKLNIHRINNETTLSLMDKKQKIALDDCTFKWGMQKRSSAHSEHCTLALQDLVWSKMHKSMKPTLHLLSEMLLQNTHVIVETHSEITDAQFPETVPAKLKVDIDKESRQTQFSTYKTEVASVGTIEINRPSTNLKIYLRDASIGPIALDKFGDLQFSLAHGNANLRQLDWSTAKRTFTLATAGTSTLSLPEGMELSLSGKPHGAKMSLPINVRLGSATFTGANEKLKLANLNGSLQVDVDRDVRISSDMKFSIEDSSMLGKHHVEVEARGLDLHSTEGKAVAHIKNCSVELSDQALEDAIREEMPKSKTWKLDKTFPDQHWRYRNAKLTQISLTNLHLDSMTHGAANVINFTANGDVRCDGTIEKGGFLTVVKHTDDPGKWEKRPWNATGHITGTGAAQYKLIPGDSLANSQLSYTLSMALPIPDDADLDWSQVNDGLLKHTEHAILLSHLKNITVPIKLSSKLRLCDPGDKQWRGVKISNFVVTPSDLGAKLTFVAEAVF
jgi:hypothetical protein